MVFEICSRPQIFHLQNHDVAVFEVFLTNDFVLLKTFLCPLRITDLFCYEFFTFRGEICFSAIIIFSPYYNLF